jgi:hypothetical protein
MTVGLYLLSAVYIYIYIHTHTHTHKRTSSVRLIYRINVVLEQILEVIFPTPEEVLINICLQKLSFWDRPLQGADLNSLHFFYNILKPTIFSSNRKWRYTSPCIVCLSKHSKPSRAYERVRQYLIRRVHRYIDLGWEILIFCCELLLDKQ